MVERRASLSVLTNVMHELTLAREGGLEFSPRVFTSAHTFECYSRHSEDMLLASERVVHACVCVRVHVVGLLGAGGRGGEG